MGKKSGQAEARGPKTPMAAQGGHWLIYITRQLLGVQVLADRAGEGLKYLAEAGLVSL